MPQTKTTLLARIRNGAWKIIRPIVMAVDWAIGTPFSSPQLPPSDPDIAASRYETEARTGQNPGGGPPIF